MPGSSVSVGHKELGIALRERGIIGNVFNKLESVTKIKREVFIYSEYMGTTNVILGERGLVRFEGETRRAGVQ